MAEAEEVPAASPKQCLGGQPERDKTIYGREGHPPSHLVEPPQGKDTPLRGGELQGGDQRGGGWGPGNWGSLGPTLNLRESPGPRNLHSFEGGGHTGPTETPKTEGDAQTQNSILNLHGFEGGGHRKGPTEHQETEGDEQTRRKRGNLGGEDGIGCDAHASLSSARSTTDGAAVTTGGATWVALLSSLSCQARERTTKRGIPQLA